MSDDEKTPREYGLVMPFVLCTSNGGPYDDEAFVVGWEMGALEAWLEAGQPNGAQRQIHSTAVPQADLLAMRYGYAMSAEPYDEVPEWTLLTFTHAEAVV